MFKWENILGCSLLVYILLGMLLFLSVDRQQASIKVLNHYRNAARYVNRYAMRPDVEFSEADFFRAAEYQSRLVRLLPDETLSYGTMGYIYQKLGKTDKAIKAYQKAVEARPDLFGFQYNLGLLYYQAGQWQLAMETMEKAIGISPQPSVEHHQKIARQMFPQKMREAWLNEKIVELKRAHKASQKLIELAKQQKHTEFADELKLYYYVSELETGIKPLDVIVRTRNKDRK